MPVSFDENQSCIFYNRLLFSCPELFRNFLKKNDQPEYLHSIDRKVFHNNKLSHLAAN